VKGIVLLYRLRDVPRARHARGKSRERSRRQAHGRRSIVRGHDALALDDVASLARAVRPRELARLAPPGGPSLSLRDVFGARGGVDARFGEREHARASSMMRPTASRGENGGARGRGGDARHREEEGRAPASAVREVGCNASFYLSSATGKGQASASAALELDLHASAVQLLGCSFTAVRGRRDEVTPRSPDVLV